MCVVCYILKELLELKFDYLVELVLFVVMKELVLFILENGIFIIILFIGVLVDIFFYEKVKEMVKVNDIWVYLVFGVIGGFDVLRIIFLMGNVIVCFFNEKGFDVLKGILVYKEEL